MRGLLLLGLVLVQVSGLAQPPQPTRDAPPPRPGTGVIAGVVTGADTGMPVRQATVTLIGANGPAVTGSSTGARTALTDAAGRYAFDALAPGVYRLRVVPPAFRGQYLPTVYGGARPSDPGKSIELKDGQRLDDVHVALMRSGAIGGRVVDDLGEPVARASVHALRVLPNNAGFQRTGMASQTDDQGRFRVFALEPGEYIVSAESRGATSGRAEGDTEGFAPTFYPSALAEREAGRLRVPAGADAPEVHIQLVPTRTFRITGTVLDSQGQIVTRPNAILMRSGGATGTSGTGMIVDPSGRFTMRGVVPGEYRLVVRTGAGGPPSPPGAPPRGRQEFAVVPLQVSSDIEDLLVVTSPGATVPGEIAFEDGGPDTPPTGLRVMTTPAERLVMVAPPPNAAVGADLTFTLENAFGPLFLNVSGLPRNYAVKSIMFGADDVTYGAADFKPGQGGKLRIVLTNRVATLEPVVTDEKGRPPAGATLLVIPDDPAARRLRSGRFRIVAGLKDGRTTVSGLLPGRYYLVALAPAEFAMAGEPPPEFFEELIKLATEVVVNEGETRTVDLTLRSRR